MLIPITHELHSQDASQPVYEIFLQEWLYLGLLTTFLKKSIDPMEFTRPGINNQVVMC